MLRAGEVMEPALTEVCKDIRMGKILIQTNQATGEPEVSMASFCTILLTYYSLNLKVVSF